MRRALTAIVLVGSASVFSLALGAVRMKLIAVELGATGVGSIGLLVSASTTLAVVLGLGLGVSAITALGAAVDDRAAGHVRAALRRGTLVAAGVGAVVAGVGWWLAAGRVVPDSLAAYSPWVGVAVASAIVAARYTAILSGTGRFRALAGANGAAAILSTLAVVVTLFVAHEAVIAAAVVSPPAGLAVAAGLAVRRLAPEPAEARLRPPAGSMTSLVKVGLAVSSAAVMVNASQFFVASWVTRDLGISGAGYFQASWSVAHLYLTFLLTALTAEYLPRLSSLVRDRPAFDRAIDQQLRLLLVVATPAIVWLLVLAPALLHLLYSSDFRVAEGILRWQLVGDVFKVCAWALAFGLLALQARVRYVVGEAVWNVLFVLLVIWWSGDGLQYVGLAYATAYAVYLLVTARQVRFRPTRATVVLGLGASLAVGTTYAAAVPLDAPVAASVLAALTTAAAAAVLLRGRDLLGEVPIPRVKGREDAAGATEPGR